MRIVLILLVLAGAVHAQGALLGVGEERNGGIDRRAGANVRPAAAGCDAEATELDRVLCKLRKEEKLDQHELLVYMRAVEEKNPDRNKWGQVISKFHFWHYAQDMELVFFGIHLFLNGPENEGWQKVDEMGVHSPKFTLDPAGEVVDIAHSYAGVRALVERHSVNTWLMGKVNTHWGDNVQVADGKIKSVLKYVKGAFTFDYKESWDAMDDWGKADNWHPPDQRRGNDIGMAVNEKIKADRTLKLSAGYAAVLGE